jgi:tight adherence protein B
MMTLPFALLAAVGVFMLVDALGPRPVRLRLVEADTRPLMQRLIDSLFAPAAERVMRIGRGDLAERKADLARQLARADYPSGFSTPEQVLGARLFNAVMFAALVGGFGLIVGLAEAAPVLMLVAGLAGWSAPARLIARAEQARKEQLMLDAASTMDRLAIYVSAGNALPAAIRSLTERPGGAWLATYRQVASAYVTTAGGDLARAFDETADKAGRLSDITRVFERLKAAYEMGGGGMSKALRQMANDARIAARMLIAERGYKNAVLMVIPAFFAIIAIVVILIAPGAVRMVGLLGG